MATALLLFAQKDEVNSTILAFSSAESSLELVSTEETLPAGADVGAKDPTAPSGAVDETG